MRICAICDHASDESTNATCPLCGEASWLQCFAEPVKATVKKKAAKKRASRRRAK